MNAQDFIMAVLGQLEGLSDVDVAKVSTALMFQAPTFEAAVRESCRRICVERMVCWTRADDERSQDYREGIERGCSDVARAIGGRR